MIVWIEQYDDQFFIEKWFNTVFNSIENMDIAVRPSQIWFTHDHLFFKKRKWLFSLQDPSTSDYLWDTKWNIMNADYFWDNIIWFNDDSWDETLFIYNNSIETVSYIPVNSDFEYDSSYWNQMFRIDYVGGWTFWPTLTVDLHDFPTTANKVKFNQWINWEDYIWKQLYVIDWNWAFQRAEVIDYESTDTLILAFPLDIKIDNWDSVIFYNKIISQYWIPSWRDWDYILAVDDEGNVMKRYFPNIKYFVEWSGRIWWLHKDWLAMISFDLLQYEIPSIWEIVEFWSSKPFSLWLFAWYLVMFFQNKIGIIREERIWQTTPVYLYQDVLNIWVYSKDAFYIDWSDFYIFSKDKRFYSVWLMTAWNWQVYWQTEDNSLILANYFSKFFWWEVEFHRLWWILYLVYKKAWQIEVYKYYNIYEWWIRDTYDYTPNFMNMFIWLWESEYISVWNLICRMSWNTDLWNNIRQYLSISWPVAHKMKQCVFNQIKIRLWYSREALDWVLKFKVGWLTYAESIKDLKELEHVQAINAMFEPSNNTMWNEQIWNSPFWWQDEAYIQWLLNSYVDEFDVIFKVSKSWQYALFEIENDSDKQLYIWGIWLQYQPQNSLNWINKLVI